jgi:hypothetical protein
MPPRRKGSFSQAGDQPAKRGGKRKRKAENDDDEAVVVNEGEAAVVAQSQADSQGSAAADTKAVGPTDGSQLMEIDSHGEAERAAPSPSRGLYIEPSIPGRPSGPRIVESAWN